MKKLGLILILIVSITSLRAQEKMLYGKRNGGEVVHIQTGCKMKLKTTEGIVRGTYTGLSDSSLFIDDREIWLQQVECIKLPNKSGWVGGVLAGISSKVALFGFWAAAWAESYEDTGVRMFIGGGLAGVLLGGVIASEGQPKFRTFWIQDDSIEGKSVVLAR